MTEYENWRHTVLFGKPQWIPYRINIGWAMWEKFGDEVEKVIMNHPATWPNYQKGDYKKILATLLNPNENDECEFVDSWGCVWRTLKKGFVGSVIYHPLETEEALANFSHPPEDSYNGGIFAVNFEENKEELKKLKEKGCRPAGSLDHGYFLLRLEYLRGFENLMCDLINPSDNFIRLVNTVHRLNICAVKNWIKAGAESIALPEDLGGQTGSLIGPKYFKIWALPYYKELHKLAQNSGCLTHFHCDGNIMDISDQIVEIHPNVFNPQDRANGIENLAKVFKGKICLEIDVDRQYTLPFGSRKEIDELIEYEVKMLGSKNGGLMFIVEARADVPPDNLDAVVSALEKYKTYWFEK